MYATRADFTRIRSTARHIRCHEDGFLGIRGIVAHGNRRPVRMRVHPVFERPNLVRRILRNARRRNTGRIDFRGKLFGPHQIAEAAIDVVPVSPTGAALMEIAFLNVGRCLWPLRLGMLLPSFRRSLHFARDVEFEHTESAAKAGR